MAHDHDHDHDHSHHHHGGDNIAIAFFLNLGFTIIEFIGGFLTNSVAIQSDALHDLGDSISLATAWYLQKLSKKGKTPKYTFGYKRFNTLGALITGIVLLLGSVFVLWEAVPRLWYPEATEPKGMMMLSILGIVVNLAAVIKVKEGVSLNEKMISWHLMEDVLGWVGVLIGSIVMYYTSWWWIDPLLSILITCYILYHVIQNLRKVVAILLQASPEALDAMKLEIDLVEIEDIEGVHHLHVWSLDGSYNLLSAHVIVDKDTSMTQLTIIRKRITEFLKNKGIDHVTIEFELEDDCVQVEIS